MSNNGEKATDYTGKLLRAYRPVVRGEWFDEMAESLWNIAGSRLSFYGDEAENEPSLKLTLIGTGEFAIVRSRSMHLGEICTKQVVKRAKREAPKSFQRAGEFTPCAINIRYAREGRQLALTFRDPQLENERDGLKTGVDLAAGQWHKWHSGSTRIMRFAELEAHIPPAMLEEMQTTLPEVVPTMPGVVQPVLEFIDLESASAS